jgi:hypothetical protein
LTKKKKWGIILGRWRRELEIQTVSSVEFVVKSGENSYTVKALDSGNLTCNCKGFQFNNNCKHVKAVKAMSPERDTPDSPPPFVDQGDFRSLNIYKEQIKKVLASKEDSNEVSQKN